MKRTPLLRRTPLRAGTRPLRTRPPLRSRKPLNPVSRKRRAMQPERRRVVNALIEAQHGRCARCGTAGVVLHGHERLGMAQGASYISPDAALCDPCNGAIEDDPIVSAWCGWKISSRHPHDPALHPWEARALDGTVVDFSIIGQPESEASA